MNTDIPASPIASSSATSEGYKTPPRAVSAGSPPAAPLRVRRTDSDFSSSSTNASPSDEACRCFGNRVARVLLPTIDDHKGKGILAGDFIKPDPSATLIERQTHLLTELHRWLEGRIQVHARDVSLSDPDLADMVDDGMWPAARLHMIAQAREDRMALPHGPPAAPELLYHDAATWAASICLQYLTDDIDAADSISDMALGFITTDKLPDGTTIMDHWNSPSVFETLRNAAPLESLEDRIDATIGVWEKSVAVELPVWGWVVVSLWVILYAWIVAYLVGNSGR